MSDVKWTPMKFRSACPCELFRSYRNGNPHLSCDLHQSLRRLARNLRDGAALCRAWQLGVHINGAGWWYPGRGDEAPEFEGPTALDDSP